MKSNQLNEDIASEPYAARGDDASGSACSIRQDFKRNFVLQQLVALQKYMQIMINYPSRRVKS